MWTVRDLQVNWQWSPDQLNELSQTEVSCSSVTMKPKIFVLQTEQIPEDLLKTYQQFAKIQLKPYQNIASGEAEVVWLWVR